MAVNSIRQVNIDEEMREAYLDYAMSVIVARALPDARDGLKPVHRRILYAMHAMGIRAGGDYKKSARIVGEVLGKYHPHGDAAVYETMVRLAQDFSLRYTLVDGQGNFGSIDGDNAAAMRYTEARMAQIGEELLVDIDKDTVDFVDNFDGSLTEPAVLPANIPNLLINGASGIAVGMSTSVPPHNLSEVCDALIYMLGKWTKYDDITVHDLMQFIKGPDFPTGGVIYRHKDSADEGEDTLAAAYVSGRGKITVRAKVHIEDMGRGKSRIIVSELPYQTNKSALIERIANLVRDGKLEGLADLRDETDRQGLRLVIELQRGADPTQVLNDLFRLTPLQDTFSIIMLALVNGEPRLLSLKQALRVFLDHRLEIVRRRSEFDLEKARARLHILEGLLAALDNLDAVVALIRKSRTVETARNNLRKTLKITEIQAQAILDMQLRRLAALERKKIEDEHAEKVKLIKFLEGLLKSQKKMRTVVAEELAAIRETYADRRRTIIADSVAGKVDADSLLTPAEDTWVTLTVKGNLGRTLDNTRPTVTTDVKEPPRFILESNSTHTLYLFTAKGQCATIPIQLLPQINDPAHGQPFSEFCALALKEEIVAVLSLPPDLESGYLFLATEGAQVKRIRLEDLPGMRSDAFKVMNVGKGDRLGWVFYTTGEDEILLTTAQGQAIRFSENDVRPTGLPSGGMRGVKLLGQRDRVVGAFVVVPHQHVWSITDDGVAKTSSVDEYPTQGRAGSGVITMRLPAGSLEVAAAAIGRLDDNIVVLTNKNKPKYMRIGLAPQVVRGRNGGDYVISLRDKERVVGVVHYQERLIASE
ncbi:MAG: DNA gyrase subunit A [Phototrophicales bacterium]|nr:MAG: DNA gyrase subunit A [Phototrophicales bacterium]